MAKLLLFIIAIIFTPTYLCSNTITIYANQSAQYSANDCCTLNILTNQNSNSLYSQDCQDMGTYYGCGMSKNVPFWIFDLSILENSIDIQSVQFKGNLPTEAWSDVFLSTSSTTGQISTTIASDLWNGGNWTSGSGEYSSINWPMGNFNQSLPLEVVSHGVNSGQLNILTYTSNPWTIFSIVNSGDNAPRLVIDYDNIDGDCTADDGTEGVELWGVCYSIENTDSLYLYEIQGSILPEIGDLINLTYLKLEGDLTGVIPPEIGNLTNLIHLDLGYQDLEGSIPPEIYNLTNLTHLYLNDNALTGHIPLEIGNLTNLTHLYLENNELSGEIPLEIGNLTNLTHLYLEINALAGSIPPEIGNLTSLTELMLYANQLTGSIPSEIGNLNNLVYLGLNENQLTGEIPESFESLSQLTAFGLSENYLSGNIPEFICNIFSNCFLFDISSNSFCPPYPSCIDAVGEQNWGGCDILACSLGVVYVSEGHTSGDPEDYIELYNSGDEDCSLQGFQLDDSEELDDLTFGNVIIPGGGYWLGYEDAESSFSSGLSGSGDLIVLADSTGSLLIVELNQTEGLDGISLSQSFDANGNGCYTSPTPGEANTECVTLNAKRDIAIPNSFTVDQNYPNPFNPITTFRYGLPKDLFVSITIYDLRGNEITNLVDTNQSYGSKSVQWDATNNQGEPVSAGVYLYKIQAGEFIQTKKMILLN